MTGKIIQLRQELEESPVTCYTCLLAAFNAFGTFCTELREPVWDEDVAAECPFYQKED